MGQPPDIGQRTADQVGTLGQAEMAGGGRVAVGRPSGGRGAGDVLDPQPRDALAWPMRAQAAGDGQISGEGGEQPAAVGEELALPVVPLGRLVGPQPGRRVIRPAQDLERNGPIRWLAVIGERLTADLVETGGDGVAHGVDQRSDLPVGPDGHGVAVQGGHGRTKQGCGQLGNITWVAPSS